MSGSLLTKPEIMVLMAQTGCIYKLAHSKPASYAQTTRFGQRECPEMLPLCQLVTGRQITQNSETILD